MHGYRTNIKLLNVLNISTKISYKKVIYEKTRSILELGFVHHSQTIKLKSDLALKKLKSSGYLQHLSKRAVVSHEIAM